MAALAELQGLKSFKLGDVQLDGTMPSTMEAFDGIKSGTFSFNINPPEQTPVNIETSDFAYTNIMGDSEKTFTLELLGVKTQDLYKFFGGTYTAGTDGGDPNVYEYPSKASMIIKACEVVTSDSQGNEVKYSFPKVSIGAGWTGTATKEDVIGINLTVSLLSPLVNGSASTPLFISDETYTS